VAAFAATGASTETAATCVVRVATAWLIVRTGAEAAVVVRVRVTAGFGAGAVVVSAGELSVVGLASLTAGVLSLVVGGEGVTVGTDCVTAGASCAMSGVEESAKTAAIAAAPVRA
jgi:hypothetical protein